MIFTDMKVNLESSYMNPHFYSTTFTDTSGYFTHVHCLIIYEKVTASAVEKSKDRRAPDENSFFSFLANNNENEKVTYVPTLICIQTKSSYIDLFREILQSLYLTFVNYHKTFDCQIGNLIGSIEFMKYAFFLLDEPIIPPCNIGMSINMCDQIIAVPTETSTSLPHTENCVALLMDLVDISSTIKFWESTLLNSHVFLLCSNEYLLFLILDAFKQLIFPMNWTLTIIPVLSPQLKDYMNAITPIMLGINSKKMSKEQAKIEEGDATILDVDSSSLYSKNESLLCECVMKEIFSKLQLAKVYYYVNNERLFTYGMGSLENNVADKEYVEKVRKMAMIKNRKNKEKAFVGLVRLAFFDFFKRISNFKDFMQFDSSENEYVFEAEAFIAQVDTCSSPDCKMPAFWKSFVESMTFQEFLFYYKKKDDSFMKKFKRILKSQGKTCENPENCFNYEVSPEIDAGSIINSFESVVDSADVPASFTSYAKKSFDLFIKDVKGMLNSHVDYLNSCKIEGDSNLGNQDFTQTLIDRHCCDGQIFYGEFGIIRVNKILLSVLSESNFPMFYKNFYRKELGNDRWETVLINLLQMLKHDSKKWDLEKIIALLVKLNSLNDKAVPRFYAFACIEKAYLKDPLLLRPLAATGGMLQSMVETYLQSVNRPSIVERSISISSLRRSKILSQKKDSK